MSFYVYILYSATFDRYYIGQTNNLDARLHRHNSGMEKATKPYKPWIIKFVVEKTTRSEAMILEKKLKNFNRTKLLSFVSKYQ